MNQTEADCFVKWIEGVRCLNPESFDMRRFLTDKGEFLCVCAEGALPFFFSDLKHNSLGVVGTNSYLARFFGIKKDQYETLISAVLDTQTQWCKRAEKLLDSYGYKSV